MRTIPLLALLAVGSAAPAAAEFIPAATAVPDSVPNGMNYQGRLEKDGFPVTGTRGMAFRLYNASTGGTALYNSGVLAVAVAQGAFAVSLDIPFGSLTGTAQKYLELEVEGVVLSPRDPLRSVPYAKVAETVEGSVEVSTAGLTFTTNNIDSLSISSASGRVGVGTSSPASRLHVSSGTGETGVILLVSTGASTLASVDGNGLVTSNGIKTGFTTVTGTLTVQGIAFSVGGNAFVVGAGFVSIGTLAPGARFTLVGDMSVSSAATFASSVTVAGALNAGGSVGIGTTLPATTLEVNGTAQFGSAATKSTFAATGALAIPGAATLAVGSTFYVDGPNGRVGIGTGSPSASSKLQVIGGDVLIGSPAIHDTSGKSDLLVEGNFVLDGKFLQHTGSFSAFDQLGVSGEPQAGQTFAVGYTSFSVIANGNVGINTLTPLAKLSVNGDSSFSQPATFSSSATVVGNAGVGGNLGVGTNSATSKLTVIGDIGATGVSTFGSSLTVRNAAAFGTGAGTIVSAAGAVTVTSGQNVTLAGGGEVLGLPGTPTVNDAAASKAYVISQTLAGSGWAGSTGKVILNVITDNVGVGVAAPLAKLSVVGDMSVSQPATFLSSVTVKNAALFGTTGQSGFSNTGVLTLGTVLAAASGGTGNAAGTAAALTTNPADCGANAFATAIAANGDLTCATLTDADIPNTITINAAAALTVNPADCAANNFATTIAANGDLTCAAIADADVPNTITVNAANIASGSLATNVVAQTVALVSANIATLMGTAAGAAGKLYYCSDCTGGVGGAGAVVVSTGTGAAGQFAISNGGPFQ